MKQRPKVVVRGVYGGGATNFALFWRKRNNKLKMNSDKAQRKILRIWKWGREERGKKIYPSS